MESIKDVLKRMCLFYGVSNNRQLSEKININYNTISTWIKRDSIPYELLHKLVQSESISFDWLLTGKGEMLLNEREEPQKQSEQTKEREVPKRTIISARDILEYHISERELEILQAYRSLPKQRQELFYYKAKAEEIEHGNQAKPQDVKSA